MTCQSEQERADASNEVENVYNYNDPTTDFDFGPILGKGTFSVVKECKCKITGKNFAIKMFEKSNFADLTPILNEINIMKCTQHPSIVKLLKVYQTSKRFYIVMEKISGKQLYDLVIESGGFCEDRTLQIFYPILSAVKYLHKQGIVHRDIKLENIICDDRYQPMLTDMGFAKQLSLSDKDFMRTRCGTPIYCAPEIVSCKEYTSSVDTWSLGVILYALLFCEFPFHGDTLNELFDSIMQGKFSFPSDSYQISDLAKDLISKMLNPNPKERFTLDQVESHPWIMNAKLTKSPSRSDRD